MKVLIVGTRFAPIPAVKGGAIEGLIDEYLKSELRDKNIEFTVYSGFSSTVSDEITKKYEKTTFRYINTKSIEYKILRVFLGTIRKVIKNKIGDEFGYSVINDLKNKNELNKFDKIVILNNINNVRMISKKIVGEHILYLHNDYLNQNTPNCSAIIDSLDKVWCVSNFIKNQVDSIEKNNKSITIYNGTVMDKFTSEVKQKNIKELRKKYMIKDEDFIILYTGRIMKEKGVLELVKAFNIFRKKHNNCKLLILGDCKDSTYRKKLNIETYEYKEDIIFMGRVEHDIINNFYTFANVQVVPSICNEAFGLTVIEGMSAGVPMIVSNTGGIPEIVENNCALIVERENIVNDIAKSLEIIYKNKNNIVNNMVKRSNERVKKFSMKNYVININNAILKK